MDARAELGQFLRSRRAAVSPEDVGLPDLGRRRVPGLRREEVSMLAGVSVEHYTRIEQARGVRPSVQVLDAIADALSLDEAERRHLHQLSAHPPTGPRRRRRAPRVSPGLQALIDQLQAQPAFVLGPRMDILAWNRMAVRLLGDLDEMDARERNMLRLVFLDEGTRALYPDWERVARETVAFLRGDSAEDLDDPDLAELVGELSLKSADFRRWWGGRDVKDKVAGTKRFDHPGVGPMELAFETLLPAGAPGQTLVIYRAEPGTRSHEALGLLALEARGTAEPAGRP